MTGVKKTNPRSGTLCAAFSKTENAKDFMPLYLFMFINVMFGVSLGVFRPLLFTEQWGYSLQDLGNTIAVGVVTTVTFSLISGWFADKYGKLKTFLIATILSFFVNVFYTGYVYFQPDYRPSLLEVIIIGNVAAAIGMVKGVVTFPLMMEYVRRDRMGAANAGMGLFGALIRNMMTLFVGVWLLWWSIWFFPQAGANVEATFPEIWDRDRIESELVASGVDMTDVVIKPLHQYGIDGETSMRWWIHRNDEVTEQLLKERKNLNNELAPLETKLDSPLVSEAELTELETEISKIKARLDEIEATLEAQVDELRAEVMPVVESHLYPPGGQIIRADFENNTLSMTLQTIEPLNEEMVVELIQKLEGPQFALVEDENTESASRWRADIQVDVIRDPSPALHVRAGMDARFIRLYEGLLDSGKSRYQAFINANALMALLRSDRGKDPKAFELTRVSGTSNPDGSARLRWTLDADPKLEADLFADMLAEESFIDSATATSDGGVIQIELALRPPDPEKDPTESEFRQQRVEAVQQRLNNLWDGPEANTGLASEVVIRLSDTLDSEPFYVTVPEHTVRSNYQEREYEYFFSSQSLMIATDIIGFGIICFLLAMEKRGVVHRAGVEEDENR